MIPPPIHDDPHADTIPSDPPDLVVATEVLPPTRPRHAGEGVYHFRHACRAWVTVTCRPEQLVHFGAVAPSK